VWTQKADFGGGGVRNSSGFSVGDKGYIVGGLIHFPFSSTVYKKFLWEYNPATNIWLQKADFPISQGMAVGTAFSIGDKGYYGLGENGNTITNNFWEYYPANDTWTQKSNCIISLGNPPASFTINGKGYVHRIDLVEYDPILNTWTQKSSCPNYNNFPWAFSIGNYGYILEDGNLSNNDGRMWRYDAASDTWVKIAAVPYTGGDGVGFCIGTNGYYGTGSHGYEFWEYYPDSCDAGIVTQVKPVEQSKPTVQVYPNPFKTQTTFSLSVELKNAVLKIYDISGREVKRVNFTGKQVSIEREGLQSGVYIYSLSTNTQVIATGKLVIE
jgi:hypothetical protein